MIYSTIDIIGYIFYSKETNETVDINDDTTLITTSVEKEPNNKKNKKVKKIKDISTEEKE